MSHLPDIYYKELLERILTEGSWDKNPRPHWADGTPAHALSVNHHLISFDLQKEFPVCTLRYAPWKSAIGEILWIYQDQSNDLDVLRDKYDVKWWDDWEVGNTRTIGTVYGETVRRHDMMNHLLDGLKNNPDNRYNVMSLWQVDDFKEPHGLKPCCFQTIWNVRYEDDQPVLDMVLTQRSCDSMLGIYSNWVQYAALQLIVAHCLGYKPGKFSWFGVNIQIYDRHISAAQEIVKRKSIKTIPKFIIKTDERDFYKIKMEDLNIIGYDKDLINQINPQIKMEIAI